MSEKREHSSTTWVVGCFSAAAVIIAAIIGLGMPFAQRLADIYYPLATPSVNLIAPTQTMIVPTQIIVLITATEQPINPSTSIPEFSSNQNTGVLSWKISPVWTGNADGPKDASGRLWSETLFDDSSWDEVSLPQEGDTVEASDRYFRSHFFWDGNTRLSIEFASDDGVEIFINGNSFGTWGNGWRQLGCINLSWCERSQNLPAQQIPASLLKQGDNIIAIGLTNGPYTPSKFYLSITLQ